MMNNEDVRLLVEYFNSLEEIPEVLNTTVLKLKYLNDINIANNNLMELVKGSE